MVIDRQQCVNEGLLAYGFLELSVDGGLEPDEPHQSQHEEDADDPTGTNEVLDRVHGAVCPEDHYAFGSQERASGLMYSTFPINWASPNANTPPSAATSR